MAFSTNAEEYTNSQQLETAWAIKAFEHAETYNDLINILDCSELMFTRCDDEIYNKFRSEMKDFKVHIVDGDSMKSKAGKELWRPFCESFKGLVEEYNFGTLLRIDASKGLSEDNMILVPRVQFWAIELARNREGINKKLLRKNKDEINTEELESLNIVE